MRSVKLVAVVALLAGTVAFGQSQIVYTLELGGNNHADLWEQSQAPSFTQGVTTNLTTPLVNDGSLTWAVRVSVGGLHNGTPSGNPGGGAVPLGAANLVFDLVLTDSSGNAVDIGAAPLVLTGGQNVPSAAGFWSSINDGDSFGSRGSLGADILANAAFAMGLSNTTDPMLEADPTRQWMLIDPKVNPDPPGGPAGPNFDYGWYPTANGRGGVDIDGTKPADTTIDNAALNGKLVGFGAGYKSFNGTEYAPGVGVGYIDLNEDYTSVYGFGRFTDRQGTYDPFAIPSTVKERVVFEGQICTKGLPGGTYTLKVVPSVDGSNILHGAVDYVSATPSYGGWGSFAAKADEVYPTVANNPGIQFTVADPVVVPNATIVGKLFYNNSYYDTAGDAGAIDPSKSPLVHGQAGPANWTGYTKGINGLIYDVTDASAAPALSDFSFLNLGKLGTGSTAVPAPTFAVASTGTNAYRVTLIWADNALVNCWLKVTVSGFGLPAPVTHFWGNAIADGGNDSLALANILVDGNDEILARNNGHSSRTRALVDDAYDYNKDSLVDGNDQIAARNAPTSSRTCVKMITVP